jgi:cytoskeletal protein CcmA (bactofilin family)
MFGRKPTHLAQGASETGQRAGHDEEQNAAEALLLLEEEIMVDGIEETALMAPAPAASERLRSFTKVEAPIERVLTVGFETALKGDISGCDRLKIEGHAEVNVTEIAIMEINETGTFKGTAIVGTALIGGIFSGDLTVTERLVILETGRVTGTISYHSLEIQPGGKIAGTIDVIPDEAVAGEPSRQRASGHRIQEEHYSA